MSIKEKITQLMPWNWGKQPVRVAWGPDEALTDLRREMDRLFDEMFEELRSWSPGLTATLRPRPLEPFGGGWPRLDVEETDDEVRVTAELPGLDEDDIEVTVGPRSLTIRGEKTQQRQRRDEDVYLTETFSGSFHRTVPLPDEVDPDAASATYRKGELVVTLPKKHKGRRAGRKITVKKA